MAARGRAPLLRRLRERGTDVVTPGGVRAEQWRHTAVLLATAGGAVEQLRLGVAAGGGLRLLLLDIDAQVLHRKQA